MAASIRKGRLARGLGALALLGMGYGFGQAGDTPLAAQQQPKPPAALPAGVQAAPAAPANAPPAGAPATPAADQRVVAYIHGNIALTREAFGEYLIQRYGQDRIELFVNKCIIEHACAQKGIEVTPAEVDAQIMDDAKLLQISLRDFRTQVLRRYGKSLYEWREDVIRPRLLLAKLCRDKIKVDDEDLKKTYENRYGKKVQAKIIIWPLKDARVAQKVYDEIRKDDDAFNREARKQIDPNLASREGLVEPIARWSVTGDNTVEDEAFKLQKGELSKIIETPVGVVVIKCIGFVEPQAGVDFAKVKPDLLKEAIDKKMTVEIPKFCEGLKHEANAVYVLKAARMDHKLTDQEVETEIKGVSGVEKK